MDPVRNPYSPGAGTRPPALVGRDHELEQFDVAAQRLLRSRSAKSQMLTGLRGVGKTVLLNEFGRLARGHGFVLEQMEATDETDFKEAIASLVRRALLNLRRRERLRERAKRALGMVSAFKLRYRIPETGGDVTLEVDPTPGRADTGILEEDLAGLFTEVGEIARDDGAGVLLTIDEVQYLSRDDLAALIVGLHRVAQEPLPLMVAGAGLPSLPGLAGEAKSYAERLFDFPVIDSLEPADAARALSDPAHDEGVAWSSDALTKVVQLTRGYPYFLQQFGKQAWDAAPDGDTISLEAVTFSVPIAREALDTGFFRARLDRAPEAERRYMQAMASLEGDDYGSGEVADLLGKTTQQVGPLRERLVKRGLIYSPRWGRLAFTVPMFDEYVRRTLGPLTGGD